ncbi:4-carboxymuconolactone decarboxylase [Nocardia sp. 348MFTsu5.1]|uniref:4-carboxymuconolactone decarboxylase n=1 Tax=Nocardia sp. 348MFTsu5.1 TaxID=1172185 RepID=UPI000374331E|nr:4-carboxymuconolactone decarboxylase [Nocardia sp. 348MFTsu5.1]
MTTEATRRETYDAGMKVRQEVVGAEYVERAVAATTDFTRPMQELVTEYCWGAVWTRDGLGRRERSMINLAMLTALGKPTELAAHVRGALNNGVTPEEIQEVLLQTAIYVGVPAALESFRVANEIVAEHIA